MEGRWRWLAVTAIAPVTWGATYYVTRHALPVEYPLYGAVLRALPAGLLLLAVRRELPRGEWWWRSLVLGTLNMGAFFALVYVAGQLLPTSVAATIMATSSVVMMLFGWLLLAERPRAMALRGAGAGVTGVVLMLSGGGGEVNVRGVLASVAAMIISSVGFVLTRRWGSSTHVLSATSWQLLAGGLTVLPFAVLLEGAPPPMTASTLAGFAYVSVVATAVAYAAWFAGLKHLPAGSVGLVGLLNPVTGVLLGVVIAHETLGRGQVAGLVLVLLGIVVGQVRTGARSVANIGGVATADPVPGAVSDAVSGGAEGAVPRVVPAAVPVTGRPEANR